MLHRSSIVLRRNNHDQHRGFTIVELLIVIVVIAILAAITIVAYNGITRRTIDSAIQADLKQVVTKIELNKVEKDKYISNLTDIGVVDMDINGKKVVFTYTTNAPDFNKYCIAAQSSGRTFYATEGRPSPEPGYCDGITAVANDGTVFIANCKFTGITVTSGQSQTFSCPVPAGMDWLAISEFITTAGGGNGNGADLYVKRNSPPTTTSFDCHGGASFYVSQQCVFDAPQSGEYYIMVSAPGYSGDLINGELEVIWGSYGSGTVAYQAPYVTVSGGPFSRQSHSFEMPAGIDYFVVSIIGSTATTGMFGPGLAVKYGSRPGIGKIEAGTGAECDSLGAAYATDQCIIMNPTAGTWYIETYAYSGMSGALSSTMGRRQSYDGVRVEALTGSFHPTVNYTGPVQLSGGAFARESYKITVPPSASSLTVTMSGGTHSSYGPGLAVKQGSRPGVGNENPSNGADCVGSVPSGSSDVTCTINSPVAGDYYMEVYTNYGFGGSLAFAQGRNQWYSNTTLTATIGY